MSSIVRGKFRLDLRIEGLVLQKERTQDKEVSKVPTIETKNLKLKGDLVLILAMLKILGWSHLILGSILPKIIINCCRVRPAKMWCMFSVNVCWWGVGKVVNGYNSDRMLIESKWAFIKILQDPNAISYPIKFWKSTYRSLLIIMEFGSD